MPTLTGQPEEFRGEHGFVRSVRLPLQLLLFVPDLAQRWGLGSPGERKFGVRRSLGKVKYRVQYGEDMEHVNRGSNECCVM